MIEIKVGCRLNALHVCLVASDLKGKIQIKFVCHIHIYPFSSFHTLYTYIGCSISNIYCILNIKTDLVMPFNVLLHELT